MSRRVSAHVNSFFEIDYTRVAQIRAKQEEGVCRARGEPDLPGIHHQGDGREPPQASRSSTPRSSGEATILRRDINIGIAVALDWGLIVPVIKHADELSLLGDRPRHQRPRRTGPDQEAEPDEVQKGTFTITNPGGLRLLCRHCRSSISPRSRSWASAPSRSGPPSSPCLTAATPSRIRTQGMLAMAYDHRIVDGADADRFLADVQVNAGELPGGRGLNAQSPDGRARHASPRAAGRNTSRPSARAAWPALGRARPAPLGLPSARRARSSSLSSARAPAEPPTALAPPAPGRSSRLEEQLQTLADLLPRCVGDVGGSSRLAPAAARRGRRSLESRDRNHESMPRRMLDVDGAALGSPPSAA